MADIRDIPVNFSGLIRLTITNNGKIGIGTSNPIADIDSVKVFHRFGQNSTCFSRMCMGTIRINRLSNTSSTIGILEPTASVFHTEQPVSGTPPFPIQTTGLNIISTTNNPGWRIVSFTSDTDSVGVGIEWYDKQNTTPVPFTRTPVIMITPLGFDSSLHISQIPTGTNLKTGTFVRISSSPTLANIAYSFHFMAFDAMGI
jgi:hypothetical protein